MKDVNNHHIKKDLIGILYQKAKQNSHLSELENDMQKISSLYLEIQKLNANPTLNRQSNQDFLLSVFKELELLPYVMAFIDSLFEIKKIDLIFEIAKDYKFLVAEVNNVKFVEVISTVYLSDSQLNSIRESISKESGGIVEIKNTINKKIIGGLKIKINDYLIDDSVEGYINQLSNTMKGLSINENS